MLDDTLLSFQLHEEKAFLVYEAVRIYFTCKENNP